MYVQSYGYRYMYVRTATPSALAMVCTSPKTSPSVVGSMVTMVTPGSSAQADVTSAFVTAQIRHWSCVKMISGAKAETIELWISYTGPPPATTARTAASISWLGAVGSILGVVTAGRERTNGGASHPWLRPTSACAIPRRHTISVDADNNESTRGVFPSPPFFPCPLLSADGISFR